MEKISLCRLGHLEEGDPHELGMLMGNLARRYPHMDMDMDMIFEGPGYPQKRAPL